jgi:ribonucleotide monophosphatase NagD (HAD superfamily)
MYLFYVLKVQSSQVVMSHSPLRRFHQFLDKHVLVAGQGPTKEIASYLGFKKVTTIETLRQCFPSLDMVDHKRRKTAVCTTLSCLVKIVLKIICTFIPFYFVQSLAPSTTCRN